MAQALAAYPLVPASLQERAAFSFYSPLYSGPSMEGLGGQRFVPPPEAPGVWKKQRPTVS